MASIQMVFDDEIVSATTLNRHSGEVLDKALKKFVTIMRNDEAFALLPRDQALQLVAAAAHANTMLALMRAVCRQCTGKPPQTGDAFEWIASFSDRELEEMVNETVATFERAGGGDIPWDEFTAVIHEWQESAWAVRSRALEDAFAAEHDPVVLTVPEPRPDALES